jgi:hypothetical protein
VELGNLNPAFVRCRTWRHAWDAYNVERLPRNTGFIETLRCSRCKTLRSYVLSARGDIESHSVYSYPDGYVSKGHGRMTSADYSQLRLFNLEGRR